MKIAGIRRKTVLPLLLVSLCATADGLDNAEQRMIEWIDAHAEDAIALLEETVNISSGTNNHDGVRAVGRVMRRELDILGLQTQWIELPEAVNRAGHLFARKDGSGKKFLLIGHLDTVFEADDAFAGFVRDGDTGHGPGIDDMKSGNVIIVYALKAMQEIGVLADIPIVIAYTGDEEKSGKPLSISRKHLVDAGKWADIALGFESAIRYDGVDWATIARRSSTGWILRVTGKQAHSSGIFSDDDGAGAIFETARILNAFYDEVRTIFRHDKMDILVSPFVYELFLHRVQRRMGLREAFPFLPKEDWVKYGESIKTVASFRHNLEGIARIARERGDRLLLMKYAYHLPDSYSLEAFENDALDYVIPPKTPILTMRVEVEAWGEVQNVKKALKAHNEVIEETAQKYPEVCYLDQEALMAGQGHYFIDVCHPSKEGTHFFVENLLQKILECVPIPG